MNFSIETFWAGHWCRDKIEKSQSRSRFLNCRDKLFENVKIFLTVETNFWMMSRLRLLIETRSRLPGLIICDYIKRLSFTVPLYVIISRPSANDAITSDAPANDAMTYVAPANDVITSDASPNDAITSDASPNDAIIFGSSDAVCVANLENVCVKIVETLSGEEQKQVRIG
jgi:hypothetical protein